MNGIRGIVRSLLALAALSLAAVAVPAVAADKTFHENVTTVSGTKQNLKFTNDGNSSFKSITIVAPSGWKIAKVENLTSNYSAPNFSPVPITNPVTSEDINAINIPTGTGKYIAFDVTLVTADGSCVTSATPTWTAGTLWTGTPVGSGVNFGFDTAGSNLTAPTPIGSACITVTPSSSGNGTITPSGAQTVASGAQVAFTLTPATGYHLGTTTGTCGGTLSGSTFTTNAVTANCTVVANFAINTYTLTYTAGTGGAISGTSPQTVNYGGSGTQVTAVPSAGYAFVKWNDNNTSASRTDTNVTASATYTANFVGALTFGTQPHNALAGGLIGPVTVNASAFEGQTITLALTDTAGTPVSPGLDTTNNTNQAVVTSGVATFNNVKTVSTLPPGTYQLTASVSQPYALTGRSSSFTASANSGVLDCPSDPNFATGSDQFADHSKFPTDGTRRSNKENSPCVAIPFNIQVTDTPVRQITVTWDEQAQPNVVLEVDVVWPPELVAAGGQPRVTKYNIGLGLFTVGQCLAKNPAPVAPASATELIGTLSAAVDASQTSIAITFNGAQPSSYPFPIIVASSTPGMDPERMLVKGPDPNNAGNYLVDRGTGMTVPSPHSSGFAVTWTSAPIDDGSGTTAPAGAQVGTCDYFVDVQPVGLDQCPTQTSEPLKACYQKHEKVRVFGDWLMQD